MSTGQTRSRRRQERGAVIPFVALTLTTLVLMVSFTVDLGRLRSERRDLQSDADAIALDAVQAIGGKTTTDALAAAITAANDSADRNDIPATLTANEVSVGHWDVASQSLQSTGPLEFPDAVQIDLRSSIPMYFDLSSDERSVNRTGVAVARAQTMGQLGSVFSGVQLYDPTDGCAARAAVDQQLSFQNEIFTQYLGISVSGGVGLAADTGTISCDVTGPSDGLQLDALSWQGLAFGKVTLEDLASQMGFASPDELVGASVTQREVLEAAATAMQSSGDAADVQAGTILGTFAGEADNSTTFDFGDLASVDQGGAANCGTDGEPQSCAGNATFNAFDLVGLTAMAVDSNNFASVGIPIDIPFAPSTITPRISIIEKPKRDLDWRYAGQSGPSTAQLKIATDIPLTGLELDLADLGIPLLTGILNVDGNIPLVIEVAKATSRYPAIQCSALGVEDSIVDMLVQTGAISIGFGAVTDADLQGSGDVGIAASALINGSVNIGLPAVPPLPGATISLDLGAVTTVDERQTFEAGTQYDGGYDANANLLGASETKQFEAQPSAPFYPSPYQRYDGGLSGTSIADAAFNSIDYNAASSGTLGNLNALGSGQAQIENMIANALQPVIDELGDEVIDALLSALGVTVAGADARINDVRCQVPALANQA